MLVHLPQKKQIQMQHELIAGLRKGDLVVTTGGLRGKVAGLEQDTVLLEVANGVKLRVENSNVKARVKQANKSNNTAKKSQK